MPEISLLIQKLSSQYPDILFLPGDRFAWSPADNTIYYETVSTDASVFLLLHELGHALLGHRGYRDDIELLRIERDAWERAITIGRQFDIDINEAEIEEHLDSYREWLHARSTCPTCGSSGLQKKQDTYWCLACSASWRVNDARSCQLKRYLDVY